MLGIDSVPAHKSTRCARGSHFQFFQYDAGKGCSWEDVLRYSREMFWVERVDFLVLVDGGAKVADVEEVLRVLEGGEGGVVLVGGENGGGGEKVVSLGMVGIRGGLMCDRLSERENCEDD